MKIIRQTDSLPLSPFEQMISNYVDWVKKQYEEKKKEFKLAKKHLMEIKYLEKYKWLEKYMDHLEVFHINQLHRHIEREKDDMGDYKENAPTKTTLSDHLQKMHIQRNQFGVNLLGFKVLPSNKPEPYKIYWIPGIHKDKLKDKIQSIVTSYKEPKHKKDKKHTQEEEILTNVQTRIDHFKKSVLEDKVFEQLTEPIKEDLRKQKSKQSAKNQKQYLEDQKEVVKEFHEESSAEEFFPKSLKKQKQKKADTIVKNVLDQQQRELTPEQRIGQNVAIIEEMENLKIVVPESIKNRPEQLEKVAISKKKKKPKLKITEKSFVDSSSNYQEVAEEIVEEKK